MAGIAGICVVPMRLNMVKRFRCEKNIRMRNMQIEIRTAVMAKA
jgi:hypothetical protein